MQARVIGMIVVASSVVMIILAYALVSVLTQRLVSQKEDVALQEPVSYTHLTLPTKA